MKVKGLLMVLVSLVLVMVLLSILFPITAFAVPAPYRRGDVVLDYNLDIKDSTSIQKHIADLVKYDKLTTELADCDGNGKINVLDATILQKVVAELCDLDVLAEDIDAWILLNDFYGSFNPDKAVAGIPVTFYADAQSPCGSITYEFSVNGEVVQSRSSNNTFTHTFETEGNYEVAVRGFNLYDVECVDTLRYTVSENNEREVPVISFTHQDGTFDPNVGYVDITLTVGAAFGSEPYKYEFRQVCYDGFDGVYVISTQEMSEVNSFKLSDDIPYEYYSFDEAVEITVTDAAGNQSTEIYMVKR